MTRAPDSVHKGTCDRAAGVLHLGSFYAGVMTCWGCGASVPEAQLNRRIPLDDDNTIEDSGCRACRKAAKERGA